MTADGGKAADEPAHVTDDVDDHPDELTLVPIDHNVHPEDEAEQVWRKRAAAYDSQYPGPVHWRRVLNVISATGVIAVALRETGISRSNFNDRRERYPEFAEAVQQAMDYFKHGTIERAAVARAVDGWLEPVYNKGVHVGYVRRFSDTLLTKLLEAKIPEQYKPKLDVAQEMKVTVSGGLPTGKSREELALEEAARAEAAGVPELTSTPNPPSP